MKLLRPAEAMERLERSFPVPPDALSRCDAILRLQHESLAREPAPPGLAESVRIAAAARLRAGEPVVPRERFPFETARVAPLFVDLADAVLTDPDLPDEPERSRLLEAAILAARGGDGPELVRAACTLGLTAEGGPALVREALKPELLRTSLPFSRWLSEESHSETSTGRCALCGDVASCASSGPAAGGHVEAVCCSWCGLTWRWAADACAPCGSKRLQLLELARVHGGMLQRCEDCGDVLPIFEVPADPLLLSLHSALAAPFVLATLAGAERPPSRSVVVF